MKAKLYIRGLSEPVELEEGEGVAAQALINDNYRSKDTPFAIEGVWSGHKSDMRYVLFEKESYVSTVVSDTETDYLTDRNRILKQSPEIKAKDVEIFKTLWWAQTGEKSPPEPVLEEVVALQLEFFRANPRRIHADAGQLKNIVMHHAPSYIGGDKRFDWSIAALRLVANMVSTDIHYAKKEAEYIEKKETERLEALARTI